MLLNNRFVVPVGQPVDNVTTFASLAAALTTAGLNPGDVIQIDAGSNPGNVKASDLTAPNVANLTIQGDPATALSLIPHFTASEVTILGASMTGFTLKNVNVDLIDGGRLEFDGSTTIDRSAIADINSMASTGLLFNPGSGNDIVNSVTNSTLTIVGGLDMGSLVHVTPSTGTGCQNIFSHDTFVASNSTGQINILLDFENSGKTPVSTPSDRVENNTFIANQGSNLFAMFRNGATVVGLTVQGNTFSDPDAGVRAIVLNNFDDSATQLTHVLGNTIHLPGVGSIGIDVTTGSTPGGKLFAEIFNNQISTNSTGGGTGLQITAGTNVATSVNVQAQGNDFHNNQIGVKVITDSSNTSANLAVNLGDDPVNGGMIASSIGGNDFHGLSAADATHGPIVVTGKQPSPLVITAKHDIFDNVNPVSFVGIGNVSVDTSSPLTSNAAFVETLYQTILKRTADTSPPGEAGGWVDALNKGFLTPAAVAQGISHSPEALGLLVDGLYLKILGRQSDPGGRAAFVGFLAKGGTVEQATTIMMTSPEYHAQAGSDSDFVQSLYSKLLGRMASIAEVTGWLQALAGIGRAGAINGFLSSAEYRSDVVQQLYGFTPAPVGSEANLFSQVLHRTSAPAAAEINFWVNAPLDTLAIETAFAASSEFVANG
jgi:hypothetical protein